MLHLVNDVMVKMRGERMVCHGRGKTSILDPASNPLWDENKTGEAHKAVGHSCVILVKLNDPASPWYIWLRGLQKVNASAGTLLILYQNVKQSPCYPLGDSTNSQL